VIEVLGEAGIGKTRLVTELVRSLHSENVTVLWGRCTEENLGAYAPFIEILRQLIAASGPGLLATATAGKGELTRLVPELPDHVGPLPAPTTADAGTEQRLLFEAVASLLEPWQPMLIVLDDLHWADDAALSLLGYLAKRHDLDDFSVVCTARHAEVQPAHAGLLADIGRHAEVARVSLRGLGRDELGSLVSDLIGAQASDDLIQSVEAATEGNPLFSEEMTVHLVDSGMLRSSDTGVALSADPRSLGVPERVRETLARRLLSLSNDALELVSIGSVIGREFEMRLAGAAAGLDRLRIVDAADDGLMSGLVVETAPGHLAFSHALVQDATGDRLSRARKAEMHRQVAEASEEDWPDRPIVAIDLARHWAAVAEADPSAAPTAATWAVRAGDVALAAAAADEAIARYETAASLWGASSRGHADALIRLGSALQHRGRADEADTRFRQALHLAVALGDGELQARAAIGLGRRYPYWETDSDRIAALESALEALPPDAELLRLTVMGLLVTQMINGFHPEEAERRDVGQVSDVLPLLLDATDYQRIPAFATGTVPCAALAGEHEIVGAGRSPPRGSCPAPGTS
jgi:predicted ATPase